MGLFSKKKEDKKEEIPSLPELPEFPEFPSLPDIQKSGKTEKIPKLPTYPNNSFGRKFSQNAIKEAVSGENEGDGVFDADEFGENKSWMMHEPPRKALTREVNYPDLEEDEETEEIPQEFHRAARIVRKAEPVFVRLDKFEESLSLFQKIKEKISNIEKLLKDIKTVKQQEEAELESWENEINTIKQQIEQIDKDVFSKI